MLNDEGLEIREEFLERLRNTQGELLTAGQMREKLGISMTPAEALLWLAGLEKDCDTCKGTKRRHYLTGWRERDTQPQMYDCDICHGTGKVPVLDLREPCLVKHLITSEWRTDWSDKRSATCAEVGCRGWLPKQGRDALYAAMEKDGWDYFISQKQTGRSVLFIKPIGGDWAQGEDTDDWRAAVKAMQAAGY